MKTIFVIIFVYIGISYKYIYMEYEVTNNNLTYIDYNKHNTHLLIMCSTHLGKHHYMALDTISKLSQKYHFDFIIFDNYPHDYYERSYDKIAELITSRRTYYDQRNILLVGSSMSGNTVMKLGLELNVKVICNIPQTNYEITMLHAWDDLRKTLENVTYPEFLDWKPHIDKYLQDYTMTAYIIYGNFPMDMASIDYIRPLIEYSPNICFTKIECSEHKWFLQWEHSNNELPSIIDILYNDN